MNIFDSLMLAYLINMNLLSCKPLESNKYCCKKRINSYLIIFKSDLKLIMYYVIGLKYYGFYESEKKWKTIFHSMHQIIIYSLILYLCSPCLINDINCGKTIRFATDRGFRQIMIFLVIRNSIVFLSMITFSLRGKMFIELIEDLRKIFLKLPKSTKESAFLKLIYISIIIFDFLMILGSIVLTVFFYSEERVL